MATNTQQLLRHEQPRRPPRNLLTDPSRRARDIEEKLTKLTEGNAPGAELAALLQEFVARALCRIMDTC